MPFSAAVIRRSWKVSTMRMSSVSLGDGLSAPQSGPAPDLRPTPSSDFANHDSGVLTTAAHYRLAIASAAPIGRARGPFHMPATDR